MICTKGDGPAVTINLDTVIGNDRGALKFGGRDFSKSSRSIVMVERDGRHYLTAECQAEDGAYVKSELKLDGSLQISIPKQVFDPFSTSVFILLNFIPFNSYH